MVGLVGRRRRLSRRESGEERMVEDTAEVGGREVREVEEE